MLSILFAAYDMELSFWKHGITVSIMQPQGLIFESSCSPGLEDVWVQEEVPEDSGAAKSNSSGLAAAGTHGGHAPALGVSGR